MKRIASIALAMVLLLTCVFAVNQPVYAATKTAESRTIAIVFDNSGSMYISGNKAWCRATYAMEVFASMLNKGDTLMVYPMNPITVDNQTYTMDSPFKITDASQANKLRDIRTNNAQGTPIESLDAAFDGLQSVKADKKYLIVLTDGTNFHVNGQEVSGRETVVYLDNRLNAVIPEGINCMYLGIGKSAAMPTIPESELFVKRKAENSEDVLSALTEMCNLVFGRDTLPKNHMTDHSMDFDISMKKLIVFVQGENVSDLRISGNGVGQLVSSTTTKYGTAGAGNYPSTPDTSLQGMMVTYADCAAGEYKIEYSGTPTSVEVYYEPDADLDFVFTDANGNAVDYRNLYDGDYEVRFGIKDGRTGELLTSELLGNPAYYGYYSVNGQQYEISHQGYSGSVPVSLKTGDTFSARLSATYLSGYTITKDTTDFGWPEGGIKVSDRAPGVLTLNITGGEDVYSLQYLEEGKPFTATLTYDGVPLTGKELKKVELKWDPDTSNAELKKSFGEDHWDISIHYKDPANPQGTVCGECTVTIYAHYTAEGRKESVAECPVTYVINDDFSPLQVQLLAPDDYIVISELENSRPIEAQLTLGGSPLSPEDFGAVELLVDCDGIEFVSEPDYQNSCYKIKLLSDKKLDEGKYRVEVTALYTDNIGRINESGDFATLTLSNTPLWIKWLIALIALLILIIIIIMIMRIKVLPTKARTNKNAGHMVFDGDGAGAAANFAAEIKGKRAKVETKFAGRKFGVTMSVKPGPDSYLCKPQKKRSALVDPKSVKKFGPAKITDIAIGSVRYKIDEDTGAIVPAIPNQKPFPLRNGMRVSYSGTINDAGIDKDFESSSKLIF